MQPASCYSNNKLNRFFSVKVQLKQDETKRIKAKVIPAIDEILKEINNLDHRFGPKALCVGSSYQGLKVGRADEFDISVPLQGIGNLQWTPGKHRFYSLNDPSKNNDSSASEDLEVVRSPISLPPDETGYCFIQLNVSMSQKLQKYESMMYGEDLIPLLVKQRFKSLFKEAVGNLKIRGLRNEVEHGPALTVKLHGINSSGRNPVSIDFSPIVQARLPFANHIRWPRRGTWWPSREKIESIKTIGVSLVAKQNLNWYYSFAECEKELVKEIDKEHNGVKGCRKKVHRIMKKFFETTWSDDNPDDCVLSSYMIKNTWFWECEKYFNNDDWKEVRLTERFQRCVERLKEFIKNGELPLYFHPDLNLLAGKSRQELNAILLKIQQWPDELNQY